MVKVTDLSPGMRVKLVSSHENTFQNKRKWLGRVVIVKQVFPNGRKYRCPDENDCRPAFNIVEDTEEFPWGAGWPWFDDHIEYIVDNMDSQKIDTSALDALFA